jgi:hypothetical protein
VIDVGTDLMFRRRVPAAFQIVYAVAAVTVGGRLFLSGILKLFTVPWGAAKKWDCGVDWSAAQLFFDGISPYSEQGLRRIGLEGYGFGHPPTTPFWFLPLADLPWNAAAQCIAFVSEAALILLVALTVVQLRIWASFCTTLLLTGLVLHTTWMDEHLWAVQISSVIACMYVLSWYFLRQGRDYLAGIPLGVACTIKLFPGLVVFYLLLMKRWRSAVAAGATYLVVFAVMTRRFGLSSWPAFFKQQGPISHFWIDYPRNASVHGVILRAFHPSCEKPNVDPLTSVRELAKLTVLPPMRGSSVAWSAALLIVVVCGWLVLRAGKTRTDLDLGFALFSVTSAFVNPWIWEHYDVFLISPTLVALVYGWRFWSQRYKDWMARTVTGKSLANMTAGFASVLVLVAIVIWALHTDISIKEQLYATVWQKKLANLPIVPDEHRRLHFYEVVNWAPWPIVIGILMSLMASRLGLANRMRLSASPRSSICSAPTRLLALARHTGRRAMARRF